MNTSTFHPTSVWLTNVIMKKQYYKTCQIKKKNRTRIQYNKYYLICTSIIVYYNYCYRQKAKKLKTAAEETMACAKYSPQVHKLRTLCSEHNLVRQKSTAFVGKSHSHEDRRQNLQAVGEWGTISFRKLSLWKPGKEDSLIIRGISEDGGEKRHCWSLTEIIDGPNSS